MTVIPIRVKKKCIEMSSQGMTSRQIYTEYYSKHYSTAYEGFRSMLKRWKKKSFADNEILEIGNLGYNFTPHATTVQVNSEGEIIQSWIKSRTEDTLFLELIDNIKNLPKLERITQERETPGEYMLEIPFYDMHWGINDYKYYEKTLHETLEIISRRTYEEINIIIGQDLFHNDDFRGRTSK